MPLLHQGIHDWQSPVKPFRPLNPFLVNVILLTLFILTLTQKLYLLGLRAGSRSLLKISFFSFCRSCPHLLQAAIFFVKCHSVMGCIVVIKKTAPALEGGSYPPTIWRIFEITLHTTQTFSPKYENSTWPSSWAKVLKLSPPKWN